MTAKPRSRQPALVSSTHSTSPRQSCPQALGTPLRDVQTARPRYPPRSARRPDRQYARHSNRCAIAVSRAGADRRRRRARERSQSGAVRRWIIAGSGRRTWLEHEHHERPQLPHELRNAHTQKAEQGAHCASQLHARFVPARSPAPGGSDALLHGVDCLSERPNSREGSAKPDSPLDAAVSASFHAPAHGPRHVRHLLPELATGNPTIPVHAPCPLFTAPSSLACHLRHVRPLPDQPCSRCSRPVSLLLPARSRSPPCIWPRHKHLWMLWSRKGVPGSKRSGEAGTPFLDASRRAEFRERAGSRVVVQGGRSGDERPTVHPEDHLGASVRRRWRAPTGAIAGAFAGVKLGLRPRFARRCRGSLDPGEASGSRGG